MAARADVLSGLAPQAPPPTQRIALSVLGPQDAQRRLLSLLRGHRGIDRVRPAANTDRVVRVSYHPTQIDVSGIVAAARRGGCSVVPSD